MVTGTPHYIGIRVDPGGDDYIVPSILSGAVVERKVNGSSIFKFSVFSADGGDVSRFEMDDKVDVHEGVEPLYQYGSLSALELDGVDDYVLITGEDGILPGSGSWTFTCRVKATPVSGTYYDRLLDIRDVNGVSGRFIYVGRDPNASDAFRFRFDDGTNSVEETFSDVKPFDGEWHHIAVVLDRSTNKVYCYLDAVKSSYEYDVSSVGAMNTASSARLGSAPSSDWLDGMLNDVAVFKSALSQTDIQSLIDDYHGNVSSAEMYLSMDDGYGSTATDESGNGHTGTIYSGASTSDDLWVNPKTMTGMIKEIDVERVTPSGAIITVSGEDYLTVLGERLARANFPGSHDVSEILIKLLDEYASGEYGTTKITSTGVTVANFISGAETTILALLRRLADLPGTSYDFYIDGNNNLIWHQRGDASWDSGVTLNEDNIRRLKVNRSTRDKKTFIKITGALKPIEEGINRQSTVTDYVSLSDKYYADDFIAQHDNLMAVELYLQKVGSPGGDLGGRISAAKYDGPSGDFTEFTIREEDVSSTAGWHRIATPMKLQVGTRYFVRLHKAGGDSSNTYRWYGDAPASLDLERLARESSDGTLWTSLDMDLSMKVYYGVEAEVTASDSDGTPRRDAVVPIPGSGIDEDQAELLAQRVLANYLQTAYRADVVMDCPSCELRPGDLITLDESGDGLPSKTYRIESVRAEYGPLRKCEVYEVSISATLPYFTLREEDNVLREALLTGSTAQTKSGEEDAITTAKIGFAVVGRSYAGVYPDEE